MLDEQSLGRAAQVNKKWRVLSSQDCVWQGRFPSMEHLKGDGTLKELFNKHHPIWTLGQLKWHVKNAIETCAQENAQSMTVELISPYNSSCKFVFEMRKPPIFSLFQRSVRKACILPNHIMNSTSNIKHKIAVTFPFFQSPTITYQLNIPDPTTRNIDVQGLTVRHPRKLDVVANWFSGLIDISIQLRLPTPQDTFDPAQFNTVNAQSRNSYLRKTGAIAAAAFVLLAVGFAVLKKRPE